MVRNIPTQGPRAFADVLNPGHLRFFIEEWPKNANVMSGEVMENTPKKTPKKKSKVHNRRPQIACLFLLNPTSSFAFNFLTE